MIPLQGLLTSLALPPLLLAGAALPGGLLAWRGWRPGGLVAAVAAALVFVFATPSLSDLLVASLEEEVRPGVLRPAGAPPPEAIVVLGAESLRDGQGYTVGPLTLERLRAGAALARRTGLPLLVTGGPVSPDGPPLANLMARSLREDFATPARWIEPAARDTHENAVLGTRLLRAAGIGSAVLVTHGWHMPRAQEAFAREGLGTAAEPVRRVPRHERFELQWQPRPDFLAMSWFALREWVGRLVYAIRD